jgi:hypothetical protein
VKSFIRIAPLAFVLLCASAFADTVPPQNLINQEFVPDTDLPFTTATAVREVQDVYTLHETPTAPPAVPEPSSLILLGTGLFGAAGFAFRVARSKSK